MDALPLLPLGSELRSFPPTQRTMRVTVADDDFGAACRVRQGVLSERLLTSIHEHREELELRTGPLGPRRVTADNPLLSDEQRSRLDDQGLIRQALIIQKDDVLISVLEETGRHAARRRAAGQPAVSDKSVRVQSAWIGAEVVQAEHVPQEDLGPGAPPGVESLSIVRLVKECELELGDALLVNDQSVVVAEVIADPAASRDPAGRRADIALSSRIGRRMGMLPGEHKMLSVSKGAARAAEALQARSTGAYSMISLQPLKANGDVPQSISVEHVGWLQARGLIGILGELVSLKSDDILGRERIAAGLAAGASLGQIDIPAPAAPDSAALWVSWLEALGLNVRLDPAKGCVSLAIRPATSEELLARSNGAVTKPETINYRTYEDTPGGLFCPHVFGLSRSRRRRRFGHITLPCPIVSILWRLSSPSLLEGLMGRSPDDIERVLAYQADLFFRDGEVRHEEHNAPEGPKVFGPEWTPLGTGAGAIRGLVERLPPDRLPPMLRGRTSAIAQDVVLVPPPDLRPLVLLDSGNFATSDLNDLLRRVINRRNRLAKLIELKAPQVILDNEMRMVQETVDCLLANFYLSDGQVRGSEHRPLRCTLSMVLGHVLQSQPKKRVDWSGQARVLVHAGLASDEALIPQQIFDKLQLDSSQPVLVTRAGGDGCFAALMPRPHAASVLLVAPQATELLGISPEKITDAAIHRPLGAAARAEAMRLCREERPPLRELEFHAGWLQAHTEGELIPGLVAAAMSGEAVRLDTPELLLVGGTGSVDIAPDGVAKSNSATAG